MKIFLTGATGFIGRALLQSLLTRGCSVRALARKESQRQELEEYGAESVIGSLEDIRPEWLRDIDAVFHLGAIRYEWGFSRAQYQKINVEATAKLLQSSAEAGVQHFIFGSTVFVFGTPKKLPVDENFPYAPESEYARSKMEAEIIVRNFNPGSNLRRTIVRPTITYGPEDTRGMLLKLCRLIKKKRFLMIGSGKNHLHLTHIDDVIWGFLKALDSQKKFGDYIIASAKPVELRDLVNQISRELGIKIWPGKIPVGLAKFAGFVFEVIYRIGQAVGIKFFQNEPPVTQSKVNILTGNRFYAIKKAGTELGYKPQKEILQEIKNTICWYQKNGYL